MTHDTPELSASELYQINTTEAGDEAFVAAMNRAIRRNKVQIKAGTIVDRSPIRPVFFDRVSMASGFGSPAAMCVEAGDRME
jgi:hypothetical protein